MKKRRKRKHDLTTRVKVESSFPAKKGSTEKVPRKIRKQAKNERSLVGKLVRKAKRARKKIDNLSKAFIFVLNKIPPGNKGIENRLGHCTVCGYWFCYNFGSGITFCVNCIYDGRCHKRLEPIEPILYNECRECRWDRLDIAREQIERSSQPQSRWRERRCL